MLNLNLFNIKFLNLLPKLTILKIFGLEKIFDQEIFIKTWEKISRFKEKTFLNDKRLIKRLLIYIKKKN